MASAGVPLFALKAGRGVWMADFGVAEVGSCPVARKSTALANQPVSTVILGFSSALDYRILSPGCLGLGLTTPCTGTADWLQKLRTQKKG